MRGQRVEPFEIVKTDTGERLIPPYMETTYAEGEFTAVKESGLKKDGTPSAANHHGRIWVRNPKLSHGRWGEYGSWVRYDPYHEAMAEPTRKEIARLEQELVQAKNRLIEVYSYEKP